MSNLIYEDFTMLIEGIGDGRSYRVRVTESAQGDGHADFSRDELRFDFSGTPAAEAANGDADRHLSGATPAARSLSGPRDLGAAQAYGQQLFNAVFKGEVRDCLMASRSRAQDKRALLRIRLNLTTVPELACLPWEYLYYRGLNMFYAYDSRPLTSVVRYLDLAEEIDDLLVTEPLRVLVLVSKPNDAAHLQVDLEWEQLQEALADLTRAGQVKLDLLTSASLQALENRLQQAADAQQPYHVFHFIGHGDFNSAKREGGLLFADEQGRSHPVTGEILGLSLRAYDLRLAVINACEGARVSEADSYRGLAPCLFQTGLIPAVVAMQYKITDRAAIAFARAFYSDLARGQPIDAALTRARIAIRRDISEVEWATPVLYMRTRNGYLRTASGPSTAGSVSVTAPVKPVAATPANPLEAHYQAVLKGLLEGQLVPFLGLDVNLFGRQPMALWAPGQVLPGDRELTEYLAKRFRYPEEDMPELVRVAQYVMINKEFGAAELYDALADVFGGNYAPTSLHRLFAQIPRLLAEKGYPRKKDDPTRQRFMVVTNNLDGLLERAFSAALPAFHVVSYQAKSGEPGKFLHCKFVQGPPGEPPLRQQAVVIEDGADYPGFADPKDVDPIILKLPGSLDFRDAERQFNFAITEDHYFDYLTRKEFSTLLPAAVMNKLRWSSHLFLGCSLQEWNMRALLFRIWGEQGPRRRSWAVFQGEPGAEPQSDLEQQYWEACRVERVVADLPNYLAGLGERLQQISEV